MARSRRKVSVFRNMTGRLPRLWGLWNDMFLFAANKDFPPQRPGAGSNNFCFATDIKICHFITLTLWQSYAKIYY